MQNTKGPRYDWLREAAAIIDGIPEEQIDLRSIVEDGDTTPSCGTVACALGWLGLHPTFRERGLVTFGNLSEVKVNGQARYYDQAAAEFFNLSDADARALFASYGWGKHDDKLLKRLHVTAEISEQDSVSGKELFRRRMVHFLQAHGQPVSEAYSQR